MNAETTTSQPAQRRLHRTKGFSEATALVLDRARVLDTPTSPPILPGDLREAIALLCGQAHAERMTIERVIVELKEGWSALPEVRRLPRGAAHEALLGCIITQCIRDFYPDSESIESSDLSGRIDSGQPT